MSLRGRSAAVAIFKPKVRHPAPKHGSTKPEESPITKNVRFAVSFRFLFLHLKVLLRSVLPYFVPGWQIVSLKIAASCAKSRPPRNDKSGRFCGKTEQFPNETFERQDAGRHRAKNDRIKQKTSVFQTKTPRFRVIARPQRGRGNL